MVSIVTKLTANGTREGGPNIFVVPSLTFFFCCPLGGFDSPGFSCPWQTGSVRVGSGFLLVPNYYCSYFFLSF
jgi:hypothetical protein